MKYIIPALIFTLIGVSCYGLFAFANIVPYPVFKDNVVATLIVQLGQVFIPIAVLFFLALRGMSSIPPEFYNKQIDEIKERDDRIQELENKLQVSPVRANLRIEGVDITPNRKVGIKIGNPNPYPSDIEHLRVEVVSLFRESNQNGNKEELVKKGNGRIRFASGTFKEKETMRSKDKVEIFVAEVEKIETLDGTCKDKFSLLHEVYDTGKVPKMVWKVPDVDTVDIEMEFEINGVMGNKQIKPQPYKASIHFESEQRGYERIDQPPFIGRSTVLQIKEIKNEQKETEQKANSAPEK